MALLETPAGELATLPVVPEARRNALLRRVDWRFLVGIPDPRRVLFVGDDALRPSLELLNAEVVDARRATPGSCDLAVAFDPSPAALEWAASVLEDGGRCWVEWQARPGRSPEWVTRRLRAAGLSPLGLWRPYPRSAAPTYWLRADGRGFLRHFLLPEGPPGLPATRLPAAALSAIRRTAWAGGTQAGLVGSICAAGAKGSAVASVERLGLPELGPMIRSHWNDWQLPGQPSTLGWLVKAGGKRSVNKLVALGSMDPDHTPRIAVKFARVPESNPGLRHEADALAGLERRIQLIAGIPRLLFVREYERGVAVGETAVAGAPVSTVLTPSTFPTLARSAAEWLAGLAHAGSPSSDEPWRRIVPPVVADFASSAPVDRSLLETVVPHLERAHGWPVVVEHRDFGPWNVLADRNGIRGATDWESAELDGLPALDLLYFLAYSAFELDDAYRDGRFVESYRRLLDPASRTGAVAADAIGRYCERLRLDPAALAPLRQLLWMTHFRSERQRLEADAPDVTSVALDASLFARLWEEDAAQGPSETAAPPR